MGCSKHIALKGAVGMGEQYTESDPPSLVGEDADDAEERNKEDHIQHHLAEKGEGKRYVQ
jgi:hypothetical protein